MTNFGLKKIVLKILTTLCLFSSLIGFTPEITAAQQRYGVGIILFDPTGLSFSYQKSSNRIIDAAVSWGFNSYLYLHSDYLHVKKSYFQIDDSHINLYYGIGGEIKIHGDDRSKSNDTLFGIRAPLGISHQLKDPPLELFVEIALTLFLIEKTDIDGNIGIGGRYYF